MYGLDPAEDVFDMEFDNFPIKGYSLGKDPDVNVRLADGVKSVLLYVGDDPTTLALELFGDHAADKNIEELAFDWRLVEGGDSLVSLEGVDESGHVTLSGLKVGKTRLVMEMYGIGTLIIPVEVREHHASVPEPELEHPTPTDGQDAPKPQPQPQPAPIPEPEPEPSTPTDGQDTPKPRSHPQPALGGVGKRDAPTPRPQSATSAKASSITPNTGDALASWQTIVVACTAAVIASAAGMLIRRRNP